MVSILNNFWDGVNIGNVLYHMYKLLVFTHQPNNQFEIFTHMRWVSEQK